MLSEYSASVLPKSDEALDAAKISRIGATDLAAFLTEWCRSDPLLHQRLREVISRAAQAQPGAESSETPASSEEGGAASNYMVGSSPVMRRLFEAIRRYAASNAAVLITGESGTGKELAARAVHERSSCAGGPFVAINCGALPATLIGSELFGYEKGAFTGAAARKIGRIEAAAGGTVFLDEIGDLPLEMQAHLLRFLQEKTIERIGGCKSIAIDARVIAATNVNLREAVAKGRFREDLYYRLNVLTLAMPPLRERGDDIMLLTRFFLHRFATETGRETLQLSHEAERQIVTYPWPGNIRELIACIRRGTVMADGPSIDVSDLGLPAGAQDDVCLDRGLGKVRAEAEAGLVRTTLERNRFNIKQSAIDLGVSRVTLYRLIQKHQIRIERPVRRS